MSPLAAGEALALLFEAATAARGRAYAPYSRFPVGAALRTDSGLVFSGCNVENASYPVGTCAEAGAIAAMVAGGGRRIADIMVLGGSGEGLAPCGACRQRILEFASDLTMVHLAAPSGIARAVRAVDLLPEAFGPAALVSSSSPGAGQDDYEG